jgi:hypothetical protein
MSPKVRLFVAFAWAVGVMCLAPLDYWAPLLAISLFCAGALTKWSGKSWVAPLLGIVTVIYCLQDMWRRGDHGSVVTFAAFLAAFLVVCFIWWRLLSALQAPQPPAPRTSEDAR